MNCLVAIALFLPLTCLVSTVLIQHRPTSASRQLQRPGPILSCRQLTQPFNVLATGRLRRPSGQLEDNTDFCINLCSQKAFSREGLQAHIRATGLCLYALQHKIGAWATDRRQINLVCPLACGAGASSRHAMSEHLLLGCRIMVSMQRHHHPSISVSLYAAVI